MKRSVMFSALLMVACCASAQTISKSYAFDTPAVQASVEHQGYCSVVSSLEASTSVVGEPSLPSCYLNFYIPDGRDVEAVTVSKSGKTTFQLSLPLLPVQQPVPTSIDYVSQGFTEPLTAVYSSDAAYPSAMAEASASVFCRAARASLISVSLPFTRARSSACTAGSTPAALTSRTAFASFCV